MGYVQLLSVGPSYFITDDIIAQTSPVPLGPIAVGATPQEIAYHIRIKEIHNRCKLRITYNTYIAAGVLQSNVYYNGIAIGTERALGPTSHTFTEDFSFTSLSVGDRFSIFCWRAGGNNVTLNEFTIRGLETDFVGGP